MMVVDRYNGSGRESGDDQFAKAVRPHIPEEDDKLNDGQYSVIAASD